MDYYIKVLILALIQGAAELLPVSSSAHVIFAEKLMGLEPSAPEQTFLLIMLHTGTMFAVLVFFWRRWQRLLLPPTESTAVLPSYPDNAENDSGENRPTTESVGILPRYRFLWLTLLATAVTLVPYAVVYGIEKVTHSEVEELFKRLDFIGIALACAGVVILIAGFLEDRVKKTDLTLRSAILIGLIQFVALPFRGFSRSGATISMGLLCGVPRAKAEDFSFALAVLITPPAIIHMVQRLFKSAEIHSWHDLVPMLLPGLIGMAISFGSGLIALKLLSAVLEQGRWKYFGFYCLAASAVLITFAVNGW